MSSIYMWPTSLIIKEKHIKITRSYQHKLTAAAVAKSLQSCLTLCNPTDGSPPGSPVPGILQARTLEWLPFPSPMHESEKWKWSNSVVYDSSRLHGLQPTRLPCPWDFPGKSTGVGCHCLLQHKLTKIAKIKKMCDNKDMKHIKLSQIADRSVNGTTTLDN